MKRCWILAIGLFIGCGGEEPPNFTDVILTCEDPVEFEPCGGDIEGLWQSTSACSPELIEYPIDSCDGAKVVVEFGLTGFWDFDAGVRTHSVSLRERNRAFFSQSCLETVEMEPAPTTCNEASGIIEAAPICTSRGDECLCSGTQLVGDLMGETPYVVQGNTLVLEMEDGEMQELEYCVRGDVMDARLNFVAGTENVSLITRWQR